MKLVVHRYIQNIAGLKAGAKAFRTRIDMPVLRRHAPLGSPPGQLLANRARHGAVGSPPIRGNVDINVICARPNVMFNLVDPPEPTVSAYQ